MGEQTLGNDRMRRVESGVAPEPSPGGRPSDRRPLVERMALYGVPGASVAVVDSGCIAWAKGYGYKQAGGSDPVTPDTLFQACSISKSGAAVAVMRLVQEGELELDRDVNEYLRSWKIPSNGSWQPRVTLRQLLSHTAGTTVHGVEGYPLEYGLPSLLDVLEGKGAVKTPPVRVSAIPGASFRYSGGGTTVVQQVLEDSTNKPLADLAEELVLGPLGMENSTYEQPLPEARRTHAAVGHHADGTPLRGQWNGYAAVAAAGLWSTPSDLCRLVLEVQQALRGEGRVLSRESAEEMLQSHSEEPVGMGFFLMGEGERLRFGHGGDNEGFKCVVVGCAHRGLGAAVMTNHDHGSDLCHEVTGAVAREYRWPLSGGEQQGTFRAPRTPVVLDPRVLAAHVGEYAGRPGFRLRVEMIDGALRVRAPGQPPLELFPSSETEFYAETVDAEVEFARDDAGSTERMMLRQDSVELPCPKLT
jgi:CubicO group peptidase (beta-lactamase class C family)